VPVRIRVRNFQSIEDAEIEVSGFTVVTGQNNSGKTATMRAVRGVFENTGGDAFVRNGTDAFSVHLDFGDAVVTWTKGPKVKPTYVVGGKTINPGRAVPDEVRSLGVAPVQAGSGEVWPQIAPQFTGQVFLLDMPGSAVAEVVSDVARVSKLTEALRYADSDKRAANAELKLRRRDRDDARAEVARFDGLDAAADVCATASDAMAEVVRVGADLAAARALAARVAAARRSVHALDGIRSVIVPDTAHVAPTVDHVRAARRLHEGVRRLRASIASMPTVPRVPDVGDASAAAAAVRDVARLRDRVRGARRAVTALPSGVVVPAVGQAPDVGQALAAARALSRRIGTARMTVGRYTGASVTLPDPSRAHKIAAALPIIADMSGRVSSARAALAALEERLVAGQSELAAAQGQLNDVIRDVGVCPTCGDGFGSGGVHHHGGTAT
jgi:hypothetical protein